jgi:putative Mg2+ transporter-C (MgtC) family protein
MAGIPELSWGEEILRIALAGGLGGAIGVERQIREREAGLRTHMLVALGAAVFTLASAYGFHDFLVSGTAIVRTDPTRIAAQIVTGIGFLGAGAIIRQGLAVRGLTTAATLWVVAAIGLTCGAGYYSAAVIATVFVLFSLWPLRVVTRRLFERPHEHRLSVVLGGAGNPGMVLDALEQLGVGVRSLEFGEDEEARTVDLVVDLPRGIPPEAVTRQLGTMGEVRAARWGE